MGPVSWAWEACETGGGAPGGEHYHLVHRSACGAWGGIDACIRTEAIAGSSASERGRNQMRTGKLQVTDVEAL